METGLRRGSLHSPSRQRFRARAFGPRTPAGGWLAATQAAAPFGDLTIQPPCSGDAFAELKREALATAPRRRVSPPHLLSPIARSGPTRPAAAIQVGRLMNRRPVDGPWRTRPSS